MTSCLIHHASNCSQQFFMSNGIKRWSLVRRKQEKAQCDAKTLRFSCTSFPGHQHSYMFRSLVQIQWPVERFAHMRKTKNTSIWTPMADSHYSKPASTTCTARLASWAALLETMLACARTSISATVSVTAPTLFAPPQPMSPLQLPMEPASVPQLLLLLAVEPVEVSATIL